MQTLIKEHEANGLSNSQIGFAAVTSLYVQLINHGYQHESIESALTGLVNDVVKLIVDYPNALLLLRVSQQISSNSDSGSTGSW